MGLMTGDVTINPTASCLIMTTEVRQSLKSDKLNNRSLCEGGAALRGAYFSLPDLEEHAVPRLRDHEGSGVGRL